VSPPTLANLHCIQIFKSTKPSPRGQGSFKLDKVTVKLQKIGPDATLHREIEIYKTLLEDYPAHLPQVMWSGTQDNYYCIVMKRYLGDLRAMFSGCSLQDDMFLQCVALCASDMVSFQNLKMWSLYDMDMDHRLERWVGSIRKGSSTAISDPKTFFLASSQTAVRGLF